MPAIQGKRGTAAALSATNPVLLSGDAVYETDTGRFKVGDGSTAWNSLAYAVLPSGSRGDITVSADGQALTIASGAVTDSKINDVAATKLTGTLADARLSSQIPRLATLTQWCNQPSTAVETFPRLTFTTSVALTSGSALYAFFTPQITLTVSQITMSCGTTAASGLTLARMGLFSYDESSGTATLVARCASDTTLFTATRTAYTRSFDTTGSFPATYTLTQGTRYGVAVLCVGTTMPALATIGGLAEISALTPRLSALRGSQSDLSTGTATNAQSVLIYARLS